LAMHLSQTGRLHDLKTVTVRLRLQVVFTWQLTRLSRSHVGPVSGEAAVTCCRTADDPAAAVSSVDS